MRRFIPFPDSFRKISKHRQFIYGFAALWIVFYHMNTKIPNRGAWIPLSFFQSTGACGVEVFLLLTGLGLYRSMKKDPRLGSFYGKRFVRVFLPSFIVMAVYNVFLSHRLIGYLGSITFFGQWLGVNTIWYVTFILTMYLFYPLIHRLIDKRKGVLCAGAVFFFALAFLLEGLPNGPGNAVLRMVSSIPIFLVGCAAAPLFERNQPLSKWALICPVVIAVPLLCILKKMARKGYLYSFRALSYFFYAIVLVIVLSIIAELLSRRKMGRLVYRLFAFCGQISLEIYLLFSRVRELLSRLPGFNVHACGGLKLDIASAICALILAVALQSLVQAIVKAFGNVRVPAPEDP